MVKRTPKDPKQEAIESWKEWHRKLADAIPNLGVYERSCTLGAVKDLVQRERDLVALLDALCNEAEKEAPNRVVIRNARQYLDNHCD